MNDPAHSPTPSEASDDNAGEHGGCYDTSFEAVVSHFGATSAVGEPAAGTTATAVGDAERVWSRPLPFATTASVQSMPAWHFESEAHEEAISRLLFLVAQRQPAGVLTGAAGLGKTHVLACVAADLRKSGATVLPLELAGQTGETLVDQALRQAGLLASDDDALLVRLRRLTRWIEGELACGGLVVLVDHLDRCDLSTRLVFDRLLCGADGGAVPTVLAAVTDAAAMPATHFGKFTSLQIELSPLTLEETARYLDAGIVAADPAVMTPRFTREAVAALHERTGGNPRRLGELARLAYAAGCSEALTELPADLLTAVCETLAA